MSLWERISDRYTALSLLLKKITRGKIANSAFVYPFHVGIFFADTKGKKAN